MTGTYLEAVTFLAEQNMDKPHVLWDVTEHKERRSLDSNAYFHVLCDKLRQKLTPPLSMAACKNHLITSYGQLEYNDRGEVVHLKTNIPVDKMMEVDYLHCEPVRFESENVIFYRVYRGSHTYNTSEMSKLIAGTIDECSQYGIQVATPDELARMQSLWEGRYARKN